MTWVVIVGAVAWALLSTVAWSRPARRPDRVSERWLRAHDGGWHPES
jgi:hypothetical protein